jgi:hypothetical protein
VGTCLASRRRRSSIGCWRSIPRRSSLGCLVRSGTPGCRDSSNGSCGTSSTAASWPRASVASTVPSARPTRWWRSRASAAGSVPRGGARRMAEVAAHLVDCVFPEVPVRQWVLSLRHRIRFLCAYRPQACLGVRCILVRAVSGFYERRAARAGVARPRAGAVVFDQRCDSALRLGAACGPALPRSVAGWDVRVHARRRRDVPRRWADHRRRRRPDRAPGPQPGAAVPHAAGIPRGRRRGAERGGPREPGPGRGRGPGPHRAGTQAGDVRHAPGTRHACRAAACPPSRIGRAS